MPRKPYRHWSESELSKLTKMYEGGSSFEEMAEVFGRTKQNLRTVLSKRGACNRNRESGKKEENLVAKLAKTGRHSDGYIAEKIGFSRSAARRIRAKLNLAPFVRKSKTKK